MYLKLPVMLLAALLPVISFPTVPLQASGVEGYVFLISGNRMPSPGKSLSKPKGIKTILYLYELTKLTQVTRQEESAFYTSISTKLVRKFSSDSNGYFKILLPPGQYSLFVKKKELFYANHFDGENNISPVSVLPHTISQVNFNIDYDAAY
jgi:hypothetical protein